MQFHSLVASLLLGLLLVVLLFSVRVPVPLAATARNVPAMTKTVYFAGPLFTFQDIAGNEILCDKIHQVSSGRYRCILPQNFPEQQQKMPLMLRNRDLQALLSADAIVANFNGLELDSGTVVEVMMSNFADMPSVLLRTDYRRGEEGWNLMASYYPRTEIVQIDALDQYRIDRGNWDLAATSIAQRIVEALDRVTSTPPLLKQDRKVIVDHWLHELLHTPGPAPKPRIR